MAASENDIIRDEQERGNLLRAIADVETAIAVSTPGARRILENALENAKKRVATLDKKIEEAKVERQAEEQAQKAAVALAAKETALSAREREEYGGFLQEEFFTKKDFGKLENFYAHAWDRLSEDGKDEMSHRFWEGIRRDEYRFADAPAVVQEKESERVYKRLTSSAIGSGLESSIPAEDRRDFIDAYEAGKRQEAEKMLERPSFKKNLFLKAESKAQKHAVANLGREDKAEALAEHVESNASKEMPTKDAGDANSLGKADFSSIDLGGMTAASATPAQVTAAAIPNARAVTSRQIS